MLMKYVQVTPDGTVIGR